MHGRLPRGVRLVLVRLVPPLDRNARALAGLDPLTILLKELRVHGSFIYVDEFDQVIGLLADSTLRVADLTTEIVGIEEAPRAFDLLRDARTMKILVAPST